jgi:serine/threonine protein kinase
VRDYPYQPSVAESNLATSELESMSEEPQINMREFVGAVIAERYRLDQFLDEGAFGAVFRAAHIAYGVELREVAIKIAKRPMSDEEARRVFGDALIMARVADNAPDAALREHFVVVHDAGRCPEGGPLAGHPYVAMELVHGGSLKHCLRSGPFPLTRAVNYFDQILQAVAFMHGGNSTHPPIAHRDLKPSNILVVRRPDGKDLLKVTDFGLAVEVDSLLGWVESGGDLAYLAPESFSHDICSPQSDVYMLGVVFYEMLSERNPFAEVGTHLRGTDEEKRDELRRLHLNARHLEKFALLDRHEEIRQRPALGQVVRIALNSDMSARSFRNAGELLDAWEQAKRFVPPRLTEKPWDAVRRLTGEAEQCFAVDDDANGETLLREALALNRDHTRVPDGFLVGRCYLLMVERLAKCGATEEAEALAAEAYARRKCRSTLLAMAQYYAPRNPALADSLKATAKACPDQE